MVRIFVGNVGTDCTQALLRSEFEAYGRVKEVTISPHYAVVEMPNKVEADEALQGLNGTAWFVTSLGSTTA